MEWTILLHETFETEFLELSEIVRDELMASTKMLNTHGAHLGRPHVDTLEASAHSNMKELRFNADNGIWRVAFAFDPDRQAILLVAGNKAGVSQRLFYKNLIQKADKRFTEWKNRKKEK